MTLSGNGPDYSVTLTPDAQWLADPSRKFPVALDPSYTYSHSDTESGNFDGNQSSMVTRRSSRITPQHIFTI